MNHIDKESLHGGASKMLLEGIKTVDIGRDGSPVVRKAISLPRTVHAVASEIAFRRECTLKRFIVDALTEIQYDEHTECRSYDFTDPAHPTVLLPKKINAEIRKKAHYDGIPERTLITEAVVRYICNHYINVYPDIQGMQELSLLVRHCKI